MSEQINIYSNSYHDQPVDMDQLISVILPVHNGENYISEAVESVLCQTYKKFELIILDDGSTDDTLRILHEYRDKDSRIRVVTRENRGISATLNEGIGLARGKWLARMDADDVSYPDRFERQIKVLQSDPELDLVATHAVTMDENGRVTGLRPYKTSHEEICARPWMGFYLTHPTWMGRTEWFREYRYSSTGPYCCEDHELLLRSYISSKFCTIPEVLIRYRMRNGIIPSKLFKTRWSFLNVQLRHFCGRGQWTYLLLATSVFFTRVLVDTYKIFRQLICLRIINNKKDLNKIEDSKIFYDDRYKQGYMEGWPEDKKDRVYEIIKYLDLPNEGDGLDFGCGNGVFTKVLKRALPNWRIYGCDLSDTAIEIAKARNYDCTFFANHETMPVNKKYDFVISHHVLEHVFDIENVAKQIIEKLKDNSAMLHIFPCGDTGSFEWMLCDLRTDGINENMGNRFFFEDEGHIRRMTTRSCVSLFAKYGFKLKQAFYSNQYYGAINWITRSHPILILKMFNPLKGKNVKAKFKLSALLVRFGIMSALRLPTIMYEKFDSRILKTLLYIPFHISTFADKYIIYKSEQEWGKLKTQKNGSEMYLYFTRNQ